jgi:regulator of Ty1 transposition protein 103
MSAANYSQDALVQKLSKLSHTQESIQVVSFWLLFHRKHAKESVRIWQEELNKALPQRKLFFLYLANDVIQSSKKKSDDFTVEFSKVLAQVFSNSFKFVSDEIKPKIKRILDVWRERKVYSVDFIQNLQSCCGLEEQKPKASKTAGGESVPESVILI